MDKKINECLLVSVDFTHGVDDSILLVGRKRKNDTAEIINALRGKEAEDLYLKLTTPVKKV